MLVIGDEILGGFVDDTNSAWLAARMHAHGVPLVRIQTIPDDLGAVDEALQTELARPRPRLIVTSGGIGSTPDDVTFEAVAASLGRNLVEDPTIADRIETALGWQASQGIDVTGDFRWHMLRMARVPEGGYLLERDHGWVPGVRLDLDGGYDTDGGASIVILPGIPSEFRRIVSELVEPMVAGRNPPIGTVEIEHGLPESALNLCFVEAVRRFPAIKLGSYPGTPMLVRLTGPPDDVDDAATFVRSYLDDLLASEGGARLAAAWSARFARMEERPT